MRECRIVSRKFDIENSHTLEVAKANGAYRALEKAFSQKPEEIVETVKSSGLRGKGGGGAPAGPKWELMQQNDPHPSYLVVNCDESEPGTFKDRQIITKDPHLLVEGIIITCYAIGAHDAYIYIRGEYYEFQQILQQAIDEAYAAGLLGENVGDERYRVDITVHRGAGAYICGEKSALLESMEGKRGHPRLKPKQKEPEWYFGNPALVNNVETIASVPYIVAEGAELFSPSDATYMLTLVEAGLTWVDTLSVRYDRDRHAALRGIFEHARAHLQGRLHHHHHDRNRR